MSPDPELVRRAGSRAFLSLHLDSLSQWPRDLTLPSRKFVLLIAMDATAASTEELGRVAEAALSSGLVYLSAWGPDCERVHDVFDEVVVQKEIESDGCETIMTTWHADEPLEEAVWFFAQAAWPAEDAECHTWLAVSVGNHLRRGELRKAVEGASAPAGSA